MTTGGSNENNESTAQDDSAFQQEMRNVGARVPPGRMGKAEDLASVRFTYIQVAYMDVANLGFADRVSLRSLRMIISGA